MIDSIKAEMITNNLGNLEAYYYGQKEMNGGFVYRSYKIRNLNIRSTKVDEDQFKISITGSLSKFFHGTNLGRFTRSDVKIALNELSGLIGFDISVAILKRIDVGSNILLKHHHKAYTVLLGHKSRYKRTSYRDAETIYFEIGKMTMAFYNKKKEFKDKADTEVKSQFSSLLKEMHLIRYELRLSNLLETLELSSPLTLRQLHHRGQYKKLIVMWYRQYKSIIKDRLGDFKPFSKFDDYLISEGVNALGGISNSVEVLNAWAKSNGYNDQKKARARKKLLGVTQKLNAHELIKELDRKMKFQMEFNL